MLINAGDSGKLADRHYQVQEINAFICFLLLACILFFRDKTVNLFAISSLIFGVGIIAASYSSYKPMPDIYGVLYDVMVIEGRCE